MAGENLVSGVEGILRHLPAFGLKRPAFPKAGADYMGADGLKFSDINQGRMNHVATWGEIAMRHSKALSEKVTYLTIAALAGVATIVALMYLVATGSSTWAIVSMLTASSAGFYYRHALGRYSRFSKYEDMPVMVPIISMSATVKKTPFEHISA
jgi:hypothetical protein